MRCVRCGIESRFLESAANVERIINFDFGSAIVVAVAIQESSLNLIQLTLPISHNLFRSDEAGRA